MRSGQHFVLFSRHTYCYLAPPIRSRVLFLLQLLRRVAPALPHDIRLRLLASVINAEIADEASGSVPRQWTPSYARGRATNRHGHGPDFPSYYAQGFKTLREMAELVSGERFQRYFESHCVELGCCIPRHDDDARWWLASSLPFAMRSQVAELCADWALAGAANGRPRTKVKS
jgi:hypothetical protein